MKEVELENNNNNINDDNNKPPMDYRIFFVSIKKIKLRAGFYRLYNFRWKIMKDVA